VPMTNDSSYLLAEPVTKKTEFLASRSSTLVTGRTLAKGLSPGGFEGEKKSFKTFIFFSRFRTTRNGSKNTTKNLKRAPENFKPY
jgi:hypothetical protein